MRVVAINGSPRGTRGNSHQLLQMIREKLPEGTIWDEIDPKTGENPDPILLSAEVLLIACPLYVDGLPSNLIGWLESYAEMANQHSPDTSGMKNSICQRVYAALNCGFYEGTQNRHALKMIEIFAGQARLLWGGGIGIGTGEMISGTKDLPPKSGIKRPVINAIEELTEAVAAKKRMTNRYSQHGFPWRLYKISGEMGWRQQAKANGLKRDQIGNRPFEKI